MGKTKTNAVRQLERAKIAYELLEYEVDEEDLSGEHVAAVTGLPAAELFKTIVVRGEKRGILVFCLPVLEELDLKKCARVAGDKKVEMIHVKELQGLTGYIRGGCSPVGMKKQYPTYLHESAKDLAQIYVSAGKRGMQMKVDPRDLAAFIRAEFADLIV